MRKHSKKAIFEIFQTLFEAHIKISQIIDRKGALAAADLLSDCCEAAHQVADFIENSEGSGHTTAVLLREYCNVISDISSKSSGDRHGNAVKRMLDKPLERAVNSAESDIAITLEVVFCPYKASMWDSLESIWKACVNDKSCDAYVVPLPYYNRKLDYSFGDMHYEGDLLPEYVPVIHYDEYDFEERRPDIVFIHNPYDDGNFVTSIDPRFYSGELKKHTDLLVYVPYFLFPKQPEEHLINNPVLDNADCIIVQNEPTRAAYIKALDKRDKNRQLKEHILVLGSPKTDKIHDICLNGIEIPEQWKIQAKGKIRLFLNTNVSLILNNNDRFIENLSRAFKIFLRRGDVFVIWREHPLTFETLNSMRPGLLEAYNKLRSIFLRSGLGVLDANAEAYQAISFSDCYFGAGGSLTPIYAATGKPMMVTAYKYPDNISPVSAPLNSLLKQVDRSMYFSERYANFLDLFLDNLELLNGFKDKRFEFLSQITVNCDGTVGQKIMEQVKALLPEKRS